MGHRFLGIQTVNPLLQDGYRYDAWPHAVEMHLSVDSYQTLEIIVNLLEIENHKPLQQTPSELDQRATLAALLMTDKKTVTDTLEEK